MITIIICILLLIDLIFIGREAFAAATVLTLLTLGGIWVFSGNPFLWIGDHLPMVGYCAAAYIFLGFFYSILKYKKFLAKKKNEFLTRYPSDPGRWLYNKDYFAPNKMKGDIFGWIFWWPLSLAGYFVSDFIYDALNKIWERIKGFFQNIFDKA